MADDHQRDDTDRQDLDQALRALEELLSGAGRERQRPRSAAGTAPVPAALDLSVTGSSQTAHTGGAATQGDATAAGDGIPVLTDVLYLPEDSLRWPRPERTQADMLRTERAAPDGRQDALPASAGSRDGVAPPAAHSPPPERVAGERREDDPGGSVEAAPADDTGPHARRPLEASPAPAAQPPAAPAPRPEPAPSRLEPVARVNTPPLAEASPSPPGATAAAPDDVSLPESSRDEHMSEPDDPAIEWFGTSHLAAPTTVAPAASGPEAHPPDAASTDGTAMATRLVDALAEEFRHIMRRELHPDVVARMRVVAARMLQQWSKAGGDAPDPGSDDSV